LPSYPSPSFFPQTTISPPSPSLPPRLDSPLPPPSPRHPTLNPSSFLPPDKTAAAIPSASAVVLPDRLKNSRRDHLVMDMVWCVHPDRSQQERCSSCSIQSARAANIWHPSGMLDLLLSAPPSLTDEGRVARVSSSIIELTPLPSRPSSPNQEAERLLLVSNPLARSLSTVLCRRDSVRP
jgi:hypothetical protein